MTIEELMDMSEVQKQVPKHKPKAIIQDQIVDDVDQDQPERHGDGHVSSSMAVVEHDDVYVLCARSQWLKYKLRKHGPYYGYVNVARRALRFHNAEAEALQKYIAKAIDELKDNVFDSSLDEEGYEPFIQKRQRKEDAEMKKE